MVEEIIKEENAAEENSGVETAGKENTLKSSDDKGETTKESSKESDDSDIIEMSVEELAESQEKKPATASEKRAEEKEKKKKDKKKKKNSGFAKFWKKYKGLIIFLILAIIGVVIYLNYKNNKAAEEALKNAETQEFSLIERQDIVDAISTTGTIKASKTSTLYSALKDTKITAVNYEVGDHVEAGDVLVTFSDESINKQIQEAKEDISETQQKANIEAQDRDRTYLYSYGTQSYNLASAAEKVESKLKDLYNACDGYGDAKRKLQEKKDDESSHAESVENLQAQVSSAYEKEQSAQTAYDDAVNELAEANRRATNELSSADSTYAKESLTADDSLKTLQRKLEDLQDSLEDYIVTSPISGTVTQVEVEAGNGFNSGNLMVVQQDDVLIVTAEIDEYDIPKVENGQGVVIKTDATGDDELDGYVSFVSPVSTGSMTSSSSSGGQSSSSSSATYKVEVTITSKDDRLRIGMSAKLNIITLQHTDTLVVPYNAIEEDSDGNKYIQVVDNSFKGPDSASDTDSEAGITVVGVDGETKSQGMPSGAPSEMPSGAPSGMGSFDPSSMGSRSGGSGLLSIFSKKPSMSSVMPTVNTKQVPVEIGIEGDYYTEIISDDISEGMQVLLGKNNSSDSSMNFGMGGGPGGMGGGPGGGMGGGPGGF